jgi:hypothetical protein
MGNYVERADRIEIDGVLYDHMPDDMERISRLREDRDMWKKEAFAARKGLPAASVLTDQEVTE